MATSIARAGLVQVHRWLGIAGGLLFVSWFASGIVMMYKRMPELSATERLARVADLDASRVEISPAEAARAADASPAALRLGMHLDRPVYRFGGRAVFADSGEPLTALSAENALSVVRAAWPEHAATVSLDVRLEEPDQWTLQSRAFLPLHRIALGDEADSRVYVAERTGEVVMETTGSERAWAYPGAVLHWLYFTPLRVHSALWVQLIIWLSVAGCVLTASGLVWGLWRWAPRHRYGVGPAASSSPYSGLLRWHHYAGLIFGLFSFTFILSGLLSMDPWSWHPGNAPTREQREAFSGGSLRADEIGAERVRVGVATLAEHGAVKEVGVVQVLGEPYLVAYRSGAGSDVPRLVSALDADRPAFARFEEADLLDAAVLAVPGATLVDMTRLDRYDAYYYDRSGTLPLPVLRVRYDDSVGTWLYLDPSRGAVARKEERLTRLNRWLYHGLHSFDFPGFYASRPLWDVVMIVLSLGGLVISATTLLPGWRRLARALRR